jgi:4-hydroxy-tetrahydrodipicolinate synthase
VNILGTLDGKLGRVLVPLITPFDEREEINFTVLAKLVDFVLEHRYADSLIVSGTTGEFYALTAEERVRLFRMVKEIVAGRVPLVAGTGAASTREAVALTQEATRLGYDCVMVVSPYYQKVTQEGLYRHFKAIAEATSLPVMLYNIPLFAGVNIEVDTFARLVRISNIKAIKEEAGINPTQMTDFALAAPSDFSLYCGDDTMVLQTFPQGAVGVVSGGSHVVGDLMGSMIVEQIKGNVTKASELYFKMMPFFRALNQNGRVNPIPLLKDAIRLHTGLDVGKPRMPSIGATPQEEAKLRDVLRALGKLPQPVG